MQRGRNKEKHCFYRGFIYDGIMDIIESKLQRLRRPGADPLKQTSRILAYEGLLAAVVLNLATAYTYMFAVRLGATDQQVGLVSALPQFFALVALIPGALLASRLNDRRRPVEIALLLTGVLYGLAGFSPFLGNIRVWYLIGLVSLANAPVALYNTTWQNYFSEIVPAEQRNSAYTQRTSMTFIAGTLVVLFTGFILSSARTDQSRILLYQVCYWFTFACSLIQLQVLRQAPRHIYEQSSTTWRDFGKALQEIARNKTFLAFFAVSMFTHAAWYMAWPLFFLTQVNYLGANEVWLSISSVSSNLIIWLSVRPWGKFIERHGIRFTLFLGCLSLGVSPLASVAACFLPAGYGMPGLIAMNTFNNITFSAFQLTILQCLLEVVPTRYKPLNLSLYTACTLLANTVMPYFGVQLYGWLGSDLRAMSLAMITASILRFCGAGLFFLRWRRLRQEPDSGIRS
jgi:MFS family permease